MPAVHHLLRCAGALVLLVRATTGPLGAQTILNVERLQPDDVSGWHWGVEGALSVADGNDEYVDVLAGVVFGHRGPADWIRVFAGLDYRSETSKKLESERYLHLRLNHRLTERWQSFHFLQFQASRTNLLQQRVLLGSGLRRRLVDRTATLDVGTGVMFERESLDPPRVTGSHPVESSAWRLANLLVAVQPLSETVRLIGVTYYQPDLGHMGDARVLADLSLKIAVTANVDLTVHNEWRHDSRPPEGVERDDYLLSTGFTVSFR